MTFENARVAKIGKKEDFFQIEMTAIFVGTYKNRLKLKSH